MFSGHQFYKVHSTAEGLEQIWTPFRQVVKARKVSVVIETLSGPRRGEKNKVTVWVDTKESGYLLKAVHHFKLMGEVVVLLKDRSVEKAKKRNIKAKRKDRKKKKEKRLVKPLIVK